MHELFDQFLEPFQNSDKERCVSLTMKWLQEKKIDTISLYEKILSPALATIECDVAAKEQSIWKEHLKTAIVRTIVECSYPYVLAEKKDEFGADWKGKVAVFCPDGEYHELGARMVSDFFTRLGYQSSFVGKSTPKEEILNLAMTLKPDFLAMSITNVYNLVAAKKAIDFLKNHGVDLPVYVGGAALNHNDAAFHEESGLILIQTFSQLKLALKGSE